MPFLNPPNSIAYICFFFPKSFHAMCFSIIFFLLNTSKPINIRILSLWVQILNMVFSIYFLLFSWQSITNFNYQFIEFITYVMIANIKNYIRNLYFGTFLGKKKYTINWLYFLLLFKFASYLENRRKYKYFNIFFRKESCDICNFYLKNFYNKCLFRKCKEL